ncbi:MAG: IS21 family transposase, partial [Acetobacteraceae bacterium]|nr:IS21 family transposase [Acetobacteraceae bacterium]
IDFDTYHQVRRLGRQLNLTPQQIAAQTGLNIKTVRKWLDRPRYEPRRKGPRRASKLDPYKDLIVRWLEQHPFSGMQIFQRLRSEHGYTGGRSILQAFIVTVRPVRQQAFLKLAFEPGDCLQIDWGTHGVLRVGEALRKLHYFAAVLCYSRLLYVEFFLSQSMECFLAAHRHALEYYGASTRRAMHDNLKTAVLERLPGQAPRFHPRYLDFAAHYGFKPVACSVGRGNEKGRVENSIGYIQKNFLGGLDISCLEALNAQARRWMEQVANVRLHRETGRRPCDAFQQEKPALQPLPLAGYDVSCSRRVRATNRCRIAFEANRYSVPFEHAGALLELRVEPETLTLYRGQKLIAQHPRSYGRNQDIENADHVSGLLAERKRGEEAALLARFLALGPQAEPYFGALRQRELHALGHVRRILMLVDIHGREAVAQALQEAVELGAYGSDYLHNLLAHRRALAPLTGQLHLTRGAELLQLEVPPPDCSRYQVDEQPT